MAQSLAKLYTHIIFSTKQRRPLIAESIQQQLYSYIVTVLKVHDTSTLIINGMPDHIHILCQLSKNYPLTKIIEEIKKRSSKWIKTKGSKFKNFQWQNGYGAFSVSQSQITTVKKYIQNQKQHHKKITFQEEFLNFVKKYQLPYDERYLWD